MTSTLKRKSLDVHPLMRQRLIDLNKFTCNDPLHLNIKIVVDRMLQDGDIEIKELYQSTAMSGVHSSDFAWVYGDPVGVPDHIILRLASYFHTISRVNTHDEHGKRLQGWEYLEPLQCVALSHLQQFKLYARTRKLELDKVLAEAYQIN